MQQENTFDNQEITVSKNIKEQEDIMPVRGRGRR